jgi:hypothetical protein
MLQKVLDAIKEQHGVISRDSLSQKLGITPDMLEHILDVLVQKGKLAEHSLHLPEGCPGCDGCPTLNHCNLADIFNEKVYRVVEIE